jgi:tetratricopeptide (TPR) repeat protein
VVPILTVWTRSGIAAVLAVLALFSAGLWAARRLDRREPGPLTALPLGLLWFVVAMVPVSNLLFVSGVLVAERTLYMPSVGAAWILAAGVFWLADRYRTLGVATVTVAMAFWIGRTVSYVPVWKSTLSVFDHMVAVVPESGRSSWVYGDALLDAGRLDEAIAAYSRALVVLGEEVPFLTQTARRLHGAGATTVGRIFARRAWAEDSSRGSAAQLLTVMAAQGADWPEAVRWARATLGVEPDDPVAWHLLSVGLAEQGEWAAARDAREALLLREGREAWQQWFWLIELRARAGDAEGARAAADSARARTAVPIQVRQIDSVLVALTGGGGPL